MALSKKPTAAEAAAAFDALVGELHAGEMRIGIIGSSPLIYNAVSLKARQELLLPRTRTRSQRATSLKHDPLEEYRNSVYRRRPFETGPTRLLFPCPAFKGALSTAALDLPSEVTKAKIGRLTWVLGDKLDVWGVPQMKMDIVRNSDMARTPDVRTRAILPQWGCAVRIRFMRPILNERVIQGLLRMGGWAVGIGDFRQEKGKGSYGQFDLCNVDDPEFQTVVADGGMAAQDAALRQPEFYDAETEELYGWFRDEIARRGQESMRRADEDEAEEEEGEAVGFGNGEDAELRPPHSAAAAQ
jgi:hypothetical protein